MSVEQVLDSVKRIVNRWAVTRTPIISDVFTDDTVINVDVSSRFKVGDEVMIRTSEKTEYPFYVKEILDTTHIELTTPVRFNWQVADNPILEKTFYKNFVQGIYIGEPENITKFPAITIMAQSKDSEWLTLDSTKETYKIDINVYVQNANQEDAYRCLVRLTDVIIEGLKHNLFPLVGPFNVSSVTQDITAGDTIIKVTDSSIFNAFDNKLILEDKYKAEEHAIKTIIDATTVELAIPVCFNYEVDDGAKLIARTRFIYNSWPENAQYGSIFKGTMLKASKISWFAWEEVIRQEAPMDVSIT